MEFSIQIKPKSFRYSILFSSSYLCVSIIELDRRDALSMALGHNKRDLLLHFNVFVWLAQTYILGRRIKTGDIHTWNTLIYNGWTGGARSFSIS